MTVKELIKELKTYPDDMKVALVNIDDDTGDSNEGLKKDDLCSIDGYDEFEDKPTGKKFLGICHRNAVRLQD